MPIDEQSISRLVLTACGPMDIRGTKIPLGCLPDGRRLDVFVGSKSGALYLRVRESQGPTRFFVVGDILD
jgi:hypothetical protein